MDDPIIPKTPDTPPVVPIYVDGEIFFDYRKAGRA
jgi:hypothetical protein